MSVVLVHVEDGDAEIVYVAGVFSARHLAETQAAQATANPKATVNIVDTFLDMHGMYPGFRINPR